MSQTTKVLSFDLDDTLWPCFPTIVNAEKQLYQWLQANVPEITARYDIGQLRDKRRIFMDERPEFSHDLTALRLASFSQLAEELSLDELWIQPAFDVFYQARQRVTLFDDVKPVLDELSQRFRLASLTNGNADTVETGIDHWFDFSLNSASVGKQKSEPDIYRHVLKLANISAAEMVHVGDHPQQDVLGARSAGVFAVWLNREGQPWEIQDYRPDAVIQSLHELPAVLAQREL
jgi:HAD superfamily hydrolase (TIGR01549 family)